MKKILTMLIGSSFALTAGMQAQDAEASPTPAQKHSGKDHPAKEHAAKARPAHQANPVQESRPAKEARQNVPEAQPRHEALTAPEKKHSPKSDSAPNTHAKAHGKTKTPAVAEDTSNVTPEAPTVTKTAESAPPAAPTGKHNKHHGAPAEATTAAKTERPTPANRNTSSSERSTPSTRKDQSRARKPDAQTIEKIKTEHASFKAEPRPDRVPTVTFTENRRIENSDQWQGEQYGVYRSYRPERHDENYYHTHYQRVELISGGYYYYNEGYWYPAWGYDTSHQYYAYDAPVYAGHRAEPLDRVIADVQSALQDQGYYKGEVDGLLGPLTREALVGYQNDNGLYRTAVIDEPTLSSLGMN